MKVVTSFNNFARGQIDHDMNGRFDLPIYRSATDLFENFETNFKGNAIYRAGLQDMLGAFQDCVFAEFRYRDDQNYLMVFYNTKIRFLSYDSNGDFGWVLDGSSNILEVTTPYSLADCRELQMTQNFDVVVITHNDHPPKDLTRVSATSFTLSNHTLTPADPFGSGEYPACCAFYKGRLYFGNTPSKRTTIWGSEAGDYTEFTIPSTVTDISPLQFTLSDITQPIEWLFGGDNSLVAGSADGLVAVNGGSVGAAIEADTIEATLTSADGSNDTIPLKKDGLVFYVGKNDRNTYFFSYDLLTESFNAQDANFISYDITKGGISKIRHKKDRNDMIYGVRGDGVMLSLNFKEKENIVGWHVQKTANGGLIKDIAVITDNDGNPQLFALVLRGSDYFIERMADHVEFSKRVDFFTDDEETDDEAYNRMVAEEMRSCIYLDNALTISNLQEGNTITYDANAGTITANSAVFAATDVDKHISYKTETGYEKGRFKITGYTSSTVVEVEVLQEPSANSYDNWYLSFSEISGLTQYIGETISVVADGGYLSDYAIDSDTLDLETQVLSAVVGYRYKGIIKSFCLGFQIQGENTQMTMKSISRVGVRTVTSAGGEFGSSLYRLEPIQELSQNDLNYLPPLPMDGTKYISYTDDNEIDKYWYLVQNKPLPFVATCLMVDANYSVVR